MHRTIIVAASEGRSLRDAFMLGTALAWPRGAELVLTRVDIGPARPVDDLQVLIASAPAGVIARAESVGAGSIVDGLHHAVTGAHAELLVLGSTHLSAVGRAARGDVALGAVRDAACAVAVAPAGYAERASAGLRRIAVAHDGGPEADEAFAWAVGLAERTGGSVQLIHVLSPAEDESDVRAGLRARCDDVRPRVPAIYDVRRGEPAASLAGGAELDLLVLGSHARGPLARLALGSVSSAVLRHAACPVVVLPRGVHAALEPVA
ncbi:universal stress protein [Baekduia soli]|nr:universal stress protein [Baekduia soli]